MRYHPGYKDRSRERIVNAATRLFRQRGYAATGVDAVMHASGMTAGGFYSHFPSKEALLAAATGVAMDRLRKQLVAGLEASQAAEWYREVVHRYLSPAHRDAPAEGCPLPALAAEVSRGNAQVREVFNDQLLCMAAEFEGRLSDSSQQAGDIGLATLALGAGGIMLARAVKDQALSDRILNACIQFALTEAEDAIGTAESQISVGGGTMPEENKVTVRRYYQEALNKGDLALVDKFLDARFVNHAPFQPGLPPGPESIKMALSMLRASFPDLNYSIEDMVAEGDKVVTRWTATGTHRGEFAGMPPTGKKPSVPGIAIDRVRDGRIVEHWSVFDAFALMQQLGAIPAPKQS